MPSLTSKLLRRGAYEAPDPVPADCVPVDPSVGEEVCRGELSLSLVSLNVQTLQDTRPVILQQLSDKRDTVSSGCAER